MNKLFWHGCLHLEDAWAKLREPEELEAFLSEVTKSNWNVFIEGPPEGKSDPHQLPKYLARSMSGGPISNSRIISDENGRVRFWARSKNKGQKNRSRPFQLSAKEFVRRWSMHILPKGYTRSRCYGGYHGTKRKDYLNRGRQLLPICDSSPLELPEQQEPSVPRCPRCDVEMRCIQESRRPSWKEVFERRIYADRTTYCPLLHFHSTGFPPFAHEPYG